MNQKVQNVLRKKLRRYNEEERDAVIAHLCVVGLKHYSLLYAGQDLELPILEYLSGRFFMYVWKLLVLIPYHSSLDCR
jgi:hypothetical protein